MNKQQVKKLAQLLGRQVTGPDNRGYMHMTCPFAKWKHSGGTDKSPSFGITVSNNGVSKAYCFSCKSGGQTRDWVTELTMLGYPVETWHEILKIVDDEEEGVAFPDFDDDEIEDKHPFHLFPEEWLASFVPAWKSPSVMKYLQERGVSSEDAQHWEIKWDGVRKRICFPKRDPKGFLIGMEGRTTTDAKPKYLQYTHQKKTNPYHMLGEHLTDPDHPVVLVEGPFDLIRVSKVYKNVLALSGTTLTSERLERLDDYFEFIPMLDNDDAGNAALKYLKGWAFKKKLIHPVQLIANKDPGDMSVHEIRLILEEFIPSTLL
jgi:DNA primase